MFYYLAGLLLLFPLLPKLPLAGLVPGYIVFLRAEDLLVLAGAIIWFWQCWRRQIKVPWEFISLLGLYALVGLFSILSAVFIQQSVPYSSSHLLKTGLHWLRYIEYALVFLFFFSWSKTQDQIKKLLSIIQFSVIGVAIYAFGQKFLHWPLFSTMNREFSKGQLLYLSEGTRPQSTFAGPYDLGGWLVLILPLLFALWLFNRKSARADLLLIGSQILGLMTLLLSGAKTAIFACFSAYLMTLLLYVWRKNKEVWAKLYLFSGSALLIISIFALIFGQPLRTQMLRVTQGNSGLEKPTDLVGEGHDNNTTSQWSANALKYGLSMGIRLDSLWPQAIRAWQNNELFGNGYGTLNKQETAQFTEADSTDNFYLRSLGETGLAGAAAFFGMIVWLIGKLLKFLTKNGQAWPLGVGFLAASLGLMINAMFLDIFSASKVAFSFWALAGLVAISNPRLGWSNFEQSLQKIKVFYHQYRGLILALILAFFLLHHNPRAQWSHLKNLSGGLSRIESLTTARCWVETGKWWVCNSEGEGWRAPVDLGAVLNSLIFWLKLAPANYYYLNLSLALGMFLALFFALRRLKPAPFIPFVLFAFILFFLNWTSQPLTNAVILSALSSLVILILTGHRLQKALSKIHWPLFIVLILLLAFNADQLLLNFRNNRRAIRYEAVQLFNRFFENDLPAMPPNQTFLITAANPLALNFYSNHQYQLLPLHASQTYFDKASQVWPINKELPLLDQYQQLLQTTSAVFLSNLDLDTPKLQSGFDQIRQTFQLQYEVIFCEEKCDILRVHQPYTIVATQPPTLNHSSVNLNWPVEKEFKYLVLDQSFAPEPGKTAQTLTDFIQELQQLPLDQYQLLIIRGDYLQGQDSGQAELFRRLTADLSVPILYTPGNFRFQAKKYGPVKDFAFFSGDTYFLFLSPIRDPVELQQRQVFAYNRLLELEKLAQLKKLVVFGPNFELAEKTELQEIWTSSFAKQLERIKITSTYF